MTITEKESTRIEAFSDGVFAIAITLLVLDIIEARHSIHGESLFKSFYIQFEIFISFLVGFFTLMVFWINHHSIFNYILKADTKMMWLNGLILLVVTLVPFSTAVLAEHIKDESQTAIALYGLTLIAVAIAFDLLWSYTFKKNMLKKEVGIHYLSSIKMSYRFAVVYTIITFAICYISIPTGIVLYGILFLIFSFPKEFAGWILKLRNKRALKN